MMTVKKGTGAAASRKALKQKHRLDPNELRHPYSYCVRSDSFSEVAYL
jgi:hypothetical protein